MLIPVDLLLFDGLLLLRLLLGGLLALLVLSERGNRGHVDIRHVVLDQLPEVPFVLLTNFVDPLDLFDEARRKKKGVSREWWITSRGRVLVCPNP